MERDKMENNKVVVSIKGIGSDGYREFEILNRETVEGILADLNQSEIYLKGMAEARDRELLVGLLST